MKRFLLLLPLLLFCAGLSHAQSANFLQVTASNIQNASGTKLASGTISFLGTDQNNNPISFQAGGGGPVITNPVTASIVNGVITSPNPFLVANPANTSPVNVRYRVQILQGARVLASFIGVNPCNQGTICSSGYTFNFDNCISSGACTNNPLPVPYVPVGGGSITGQSPGAVSIGGSSTTITSNKPVVGTDANIPTAGTLSGSAGAAVCKDSNGGIDTTGCSSNSFPIQSAYYIFQSNSNTCTPPTINGTYTCARNNQTGNVDYYGTDAAVVLRSAISNISTTCGSLDFDLGIYPLNSLLQESNNGMSNYYALGFPSQASANQFCKWSLNGQTDPTHVGSFFSGANVQTGGVILNLTSTAINSVSSTAKIVGLWQRPPASGGVNAAGSYLEANHLDVRVPDNQRGCYSAINWEFGLQMELHDVQIDTAVPSQSLQYPVEASCTAWGDSDRGGFVGLTTTNSEKNINVIDGVDTWGADESYDLRSEHVTLTRSYANFCNYGIEYGVNVGPSGASIHFPSQFGPVAGWQNCSRGLTIGTNFATTHPQLKGILNTEDDASPPWTVVYHAADNSNGALSGSLIFNPNVLLIPTPWDGGATNSVISWCMYNACVNPAQTFATTASCLASRSGMTATITDSTVNSWGDAITTGGGSYNVYAYCNGNTYVVTGAAPGWALVQSPHNFTCSAASTCAVTLTSMPVAGNALLLLAMWYNASGATTLSSANNETWTHPAGCHASANYTGTKYVSTDCMYVLSATGGESSITATFSGSTDAADVCVFELHRSSGTAIFDTSGAATPTSANPTGPTLTLSGQDYVAQLIATPQTINSAPGAPWSNPTGTPDNTNVAGACTGAVNQITGTGPTWPLAMSTQVATSGVALK